MQKHLSKENAFCKKTCTNKKTPTKNKVQKTFTLFRSDVFYTSGQNFTWMDKLLRKELVLIKRCFSDEKMFCWKS